MAVLTPEVIGAMRQLSPETRFVYLRELLRFADPLSSPAAFAVHHADECGLEWDPYEHLVYLSDAIVDGVIHDDWDVLLVTTPPRHGKTEFLSRWVPAWFICAFRLRVGLASYEADFARTHGRRVRDIVEAVGPRYGVTVRRDSKAADLWDIVESPSGGMWTAGAGGPVTGKGYVLGVLDDPHKNMEDAKSPVLREQKWEWWTSTFFTRRERGRRVKIRPKTIVILTRWHEDDLGGRIKRTAKYGRNAVRLRHINMPAVAEEGDELGRPIGAPLCPDRYSSADLEGIREAVGGSVWSALYQQRPQIAGGNIFRRSWFRYWRRTSNGQIVLLSRDEEGIEHERALPDPDNVWLFDIFDPAYTKGKRSDYSVIGHFGATQIDAKTALLLMDGSRVKVHATEHVPLVRDYWDRKDKPAWIGVEKHYANLAMFDELIRTGVVVRWLKPDKNKTARAQTAAAMFENGLVYLPADAWWLDDWCEELLSFDTGEHDDVVDVVAYACNEVARGGVMARRPKTPDKSRIEAHVERMCRQQRRTTSFDSLLGR